LQVWDIDFAETALSLTRRIKPLWGKNQVESSLFKFETVVHQIMRQPFTPPPIGRLVVRYVNHRRQPIRKCR